jgi:hypothetical protein
MQRQTETSIPGDEEHVEFASNEDVFPIQDADAVTGRDEAFRSFEKRHASFQSIMDSSYRRRM